MKNLVDVPKRVRIDLKIVPVEHTDQVQEVALYPDPVIQPPHPRRRPEDGQPQEEQAEE